MSHYGTWAMLDTWEVREGARLFAEYFLQQQNWSDGGTYRAAYRYKYGEIYRAAISDIDAGKLHPVYHSTGVEEVHDEVYGHHDVTVTYGDTTVKNDHFVKWAYGKRLALPNEFSQLMHEATNPDGPQVETILGTESDDAGQEDLELVYPAYKGVKLEDVDKEMFEQIKKFYGMLQRELSKWKKGLPIAVNVGLLFYEGQLPKPATASEFMAVYKKQSGGVPMKIGEAIYDALPDSYRNLGGPVASDSLMLDEDMIDTVVDASVAAGMMATGSGVENSTDLERKLTRLEIEMPPPEYLKAISGACKRISKRYKTQNL